MFMNSVVLNAPTGSDCEGVTAFVFAVLSDCEETAFVFVVLSDCEETAFVFVF
jgi:hypothetical protein